MNTTPVVMDGVTYRVRIRSDPPLEESFRIEDGPNIGTSMGGTDIRDILGTYYDHTLSVEPDPSYPGDYDAFYLAISAPVASHTITMPHGNGTITYQAKIISGSHKYKGIIAGRKRYTGLNVYAQAITPQRPA